MERQKDMRAVYHPGVNEELNQYIYFKPELVPALNIKMSQTKYYIFKFPTSLLRYRQIIHFMDNFNLVYQKIHK